MKIPILFNDKISGWNRDVLPLYGIYPASEHIKFKGVFEFCQKHFEYVNSENAIVVFPELLNYEICTEKRDLLDSFSNRKVFGFSNDIVDDEYSYDENITLYRTALLKSRKKENEHSFPAFCEDRFEHKYADNISIGYCGHLMYGRKELIDKLRSLNIETDLIIRNELLTGTDNTILRNEFYKNIEKNLFTFCYRGAGNYCYRFYETLMMGRIPLLFASDRDFIFETDFNINDVCVVLNTQDSALEIQNKIHSFIQKNNIKEMQKQNRYIWENYCSPIGFLKQFIKFIQENIIKK